MGKTVVYTTIEEIVHPSHTVLVVWDVLQALVDSIFNKEMFLTSIKSFIVSARKSEVPIVYTQIDPEPAEYQSPWRLFMAMRRHGVDDPEKLAQDRPLDSPAYQIHHEVTPSDSDHILTNKHTASIFIGTNFEKMMRNRGIDTILFTGIATDFGIDSSARDSANRGFYTAIVEDCVSSRDREMHDAALKTVRNLCLVYPSSDIIKAWEY